VDIPQKIRELLKIRLLKPGDRIILENFQATLAQMQMLSPAQMELVTTKYEEMKFMRKVGKFMRKVGNKPPYYGKASGGDHQWKDISEDGLKKQLDLLGVDKLEDTVDKLNPMDLKERTAWVELSDEIGKIKE